MPQPASPMSEPKRILRWTDRTAQHLVDSSPEWLIGNGLGGYACGTVTGVMTRRYHALLVAALPVPLGRTIMLDLLVETLRRPDGRSMRLGARQLGETEAENDGGNLTEFRLEQGLPVWRFEAEGFVVERRAVLLTSAEHGHHAAGGWSMAPRRRRWNCAPLCISARTTRVSVKTPGAFTASPPPAITTRSVLAEDLPPLRLLMRGDNPLLTLDGGMRHELTYEAEARRGYDSRGMLWSPGFFSTQIDPERDVWLIASTERWEDVTTLRPVDAVRQEHTRRQTLIERAEPRLRESPADELVLAADAFVITPPREISTGRPADDAPHASIVAGYHWFTDWGRDTMISLEGLTLLTGRHDEARGILRTFAKHIRDGLIPNFFSEHEGQGLYHTADATLWFFHALDRYVELTGDRDTLRELLPKLIDVVEHHRQGTRFGIGVDPEDGLLRQGAEGIS